MKKTKLCLNVMLGNEEHVVERMLNSCYKYIDYWVIQCNGTDRTQQIVEDFFAEKGIPGFTYTTEWQYPGWNSDHLIQKCAEADHGCDWFFRIDADEQLQVDDDFDWSVLEDTTIDSWNVVASADNGLWYRCRLWNTNIPWRFRHDKRHECILKPGCGPTEEEFPRIELDKGFRHIITSDGDTWTNPTKFFSDAVELENQHVSNWTLLEDMYHFWYIGKSYYDAVNVGNYPLGETHSREYARRCIFYFDEYMNRMFNNAPQVNELGYYALFAMGNMYRRCEDYENAIDCYIRAEEFCPPRNEHIVGLAETYRTMEDWQSMKMQTERLVDPERKMPFPQFSFLLHTNFYIDAGDYGKSLHQIACNNYK